MNQNFQCLTYKGKGNSLISLKGKTKDLFKQFDSFVRVSTCQRIEIYSEKNLSSLEDMNKLDFPDSMIHLIEVLSGVDSGLFGEIEVYLQIKESLKTAKKEKHLSSELGNLFSQAFEISDNIREKFELNNSWANSIEEVISKRKNIFIFGDGNLAKSLEKNLSSKGFNFLDNPKNAEAIVILKKGFKPSNKTAKIINLTAILHWQSLVALITTKKSLYMDITVLEKALI